MNDAGNHAIDTASAMPVDTAESAMCATGGRKVPVDTIIAALRTVRDPEIPLNIYDLGLIYRIDVRDHGLVVIEMTLTAPGCPVAGEIVRSVQNAVNDLNGVDSVKVDLVFDPPWDQSKMSLEAKLELGLV